MEELQQKDNDLQNYYRLQSNGFYKVKELDDYERTILKEKFRKLGFSALNFTDSRSKYQFYPLDRLWDDIQIALENDIRVWHPATEPVSAEEVYRFLSGKTFDNKLNGCPADYDYKTIFDMEYKGESGYIMNKGEVLAKIEEFVRNEK